MAMTGPVSERSGIPVELAVRELFGVFVDLLGKQRG